jgi:hypothetical protein
MGCSHSKRKPENIHTGAQRLQGEIYKYKNFNYSESKNSEDTSPPLHVAGPAFPDKSFIQESSINVSQPNIKKTNPGKRHNYL